jgi:hypothetical protein
MADNISKGLSFLTLVGFGLVIFFASGREI